ncbi:MAG: hypothetical protein AAGF78_10425 [Pseudomonadota bacterium]
MNMVAQSSGTFDWPILRDGIPRGLSGSQAQSGPLESLPPGKARRIQGVLGPPLGIFAPASGWQRAFRAACTILGFRAQAPFAQDRDGVHQAALPLALPETVQFP